MTRLRLLWLVDQMITVETLGSSSKGNCYRLLSGGRALLLECGLPWKEIRRKLNFETSELDGCLVSHHHGDHSRSIKEVMAAGIDVFASLETFKNLDIQLSHRAHVIHETLENGMFAVCHTAPLGPWSVRPFDTVHDSPGSIGFFIEDRSGDKLLFLTDTAYCKYRFHRINIIMIEANFSEAILERNVNAGMIDPARAKRVRENHFSIEKVIDFLKANDLSRCRATHLLHLSDGNSDAEMFKKMVQEATGIPVKVEG